MFVFKKMYRILLFFVSALLCAPSAALAAEGAAAAHRVSMIPYTLFEVFGVPITNSMATSWVISLLLILAVRLAVGRVTLVPSRAQAVVEVIIEEAKALLLPVVGAKALRSVFPIILSYFFFILINNLSGLFPGVGAFGFYDDEHHLKYWLRPGNADLNMTLALAITSSMLWFYFMVRYEGILHFIIGTFSNKSNRADVPALIYYPLSLIFIGVGFLELIGLIVRPVSLAFRLFGNVYGGETLLSDMLSSSSQSLLGFVAPVPFYFLELLIGVVQALVFSLLTGLYIGFCTNVGHEMIPLKDHFSSEEKIKESLSHEKNF